MRDILIFSQAEPLRKHLDTLYSCNSHPMEIFDVHLNFPRRDHSTIHWQDFPNIFSRKSVADCIRRAITFITDREMPYCRLLATSSSVFRAFQERERQIHLFYRNRLFPRAYNSSFIIISSSKVVLMNERSKSVNTVAFYIQERLMRYFHRLIFHLRVGLPRYFRREKLRKIAEIRPSSDVD